MTHDRSEGDCLELTQETICQILGVRRESVTQAAMALQDAGLIQYRRGRIKVLARAGLEQVACECYAVVKREYERLLPTNPAAPAVSPPSTDAVRPHAHPQYLAEPAERELCIAW